MGGRRRLHCPECGSYLGRMPPVNQTRKGLPPVLQKIFDMLQEAGVPGVTAVDISIGLYGPEEGVQAAAMTATQVHLSRLRLRLRERGWDVPKLSRAKKEARYRLMPMEG